MAALRGSAGRALRRERERERERDRASGPERAPVCPSATGRRGWAGVRKFPDLRCDKQLSPNIGRKRA